METLKKLAYPLGGFSQGVYVAFTNAVLPLFLSLFTTNTVLIGALITAGTFEGALAPLLVGPLSDRFNSPLGRRKPFLILGVIGTALLLMLVSFTHNLFLISAIILLVGLARSITVAPHMAMLSQNSTLATRSHIASLVAIFSLFGQVALAFVVSFFWTTLSIPMIFFLIALFFAIPTLATILWSKDIADKSRSENTFDIRLFFSDKKRNRYIYSQVFLWFGLNMVIPFFTLYLSEYLSFSPGKAIFLYMLIVAASGVFAHAFVRLGKKVGEIKAFRLGLVAFTLAAVVGIFAKSMPEFSLYLLAILAGAGNAAGLVYSFTLLTKMTQEDQMGITSGLYAFIMAGSAPVAAITSGLAISVFGYPVMFVGLAVTTVLCFLLLEEKVRLRFW